MIGIGQRILSETNLLIDDKPHFFKSLITNPEKYLQWQDVEDCLNNPYVYQFELIGKDGVKIYVPQNKVAWIGDREVQDKRFLIDKFNEGNGLVILNYGFRNRDTMELLKEFESIFHINAAIHVYCGLDDATSFTIHDDYPANFIIQVEGTTDWKVFRNRISYMHRTGLMNDKLKDSDLDVEIEVTLEPGDALYIPSRAYHVARPVGKRLSMSIPCWSRLPTDPPNQSVDRNYYEIRS